LDSENENRSKKKNKELQDSKKKRKRRTKKLSEKESFHPKGGKKVADRKNLGRKI